MRCVTTLVASIVSGPSGMSRCVCTYHRVGVGVLPPSVGGKRTGFSMSNKSVHCKLTTVGDVKEPIVGSVIRSERRLKLFRGLRSFVAHLSTGGMLGGHAVRGLVGTKTLSALNKAEGRFVDVCMRVMSRMARRGGGSVIKRVALFSLIDRSRGRRFRVEVPSIKRCSGRALLTFRGRMLKVCIDKRPLRTCRRG